MGCGRPKLKPLIPNTDCNRNVSDSLSLFSIRNRQIKRRSRGKFQWFTRSSPRRNLKTWGWLWATASCKGRIEVAPSIYTLSMPLTARNLISSMICSSSWPVLSRWRTAEPGFTSPKNSSVLVGINLRPSSMTLCLTPYRLQSAICSKKCIVAWLKASVLVNGARLSSFLRWSLILETSCFSLAPDLDSNSVMHSSKAWFSTISL